MSKKINTLIVLFNISFFTNYCSSKAIILGEPKAKEQLALKNQLNKKILIVVSAHGQMGNTDKKTGYYLSEVSHFYHVLSGQGFAIDFTTPFGRKPIMDPSSHNLDDGINKAFVENKLAWSALNNPLNPAALKASDYALIYFAGGYGAMWDFPDNKELTQLAADVYENGNVVSAVCHGVAGLLNVKLSNGKHLIYKKQVTGFGNFEETLAGNKSAIPYLLADELESRLAKYSGNFIPFTSNIATDTRLITGQNPASTIDLANEVVRALENNPVKKP